MKSRHLFSIAALGVCLIIAPVRAMVAIISHPPGPAPFGWAYHYVAPAYQTVTDQHWIPERITYVPVWAEIVPGRWEQVLREVVTPGHFEFTTRQIVVAPGHWDLVRIELPPIIVQPPVVIIPRPAFANPGTVGVDGYSSGPSEDLSGFSGLTEWPR